MLEALTRPALLPSRTRLYTQGRRDRDARTLPCHHPPSYRSFSVCTSFVTNRRALSRLLIGTVKVRVVEGVLEFISVASLTASSLPFPGSRCEYSVSTERFGKVSRFSDNEDLWAIKHRNIEGLGLVAFSEPRERATTARGYVCRCHSQRVVPAPECLSARSRGGRPASTAIVVSDVSLCSRAAANAFPARGEVTSAGGGQCRGRTRIGTTLDDSKNIHKARGPLIDLIDMTIPDTRARRATSTHGAEIDGRAQSADRQASAGAARRAAAGGDAPPPAVFATRSQGQFTQTHEYRTGQQRSDYGAEGGGLTAATAVVVEPRRARSTPPADEAVAKPCHDVWPKTLLTRLPYRMYFYRVKLISPRIDRLRDWTEGRLDFYER
ncbi:hypothetical protein EVAR_8218_1 [Eumeta japonica]|uniref:Uncharacterized protein n=1 Tax=Eumeta variegata TaxID=151549 RepID=A0A4C1TFK1_EUMVA|nr:hypothetical protein EVAR_8218_1 [Eumeta japonica]